MGSGRNWLLTSSKGFTVFGRPVGKVFVLNGACGGKGGREGGEEGRREGGRGRRRERGREGRGEGGREGGRENQLRMLIIVYKYFEPYAALPEPLLYP